MGSELRLRSGTSIRQTYGRGCLDSRGEKLHWEVRLRLIKLAHAVLHREIIREVVVEDVI
jgi:hypothetical protein